MPDTESVLEKLPSAIDISCVQAEHGRNDVERLAAAARAGNFVSAHVLPNWVPVLHELLQNAHTLVGSPIGFPSGGSTTATKIAEADELLALGAEELDVVVAIGRLRSGESGYVIRELSALVELVDGRVPLRAILEVGRLDEDQIARGVDAVLEAGVSWIKTGTGWSGIPTTLAHVEQIARQSRGGAQIKAAGGIRDLTTIRAMAEAGASRFGMNTSAALAVVSGRARS